jgi:hypothetical protein
MMKRYLVIQALASLAHNENFDASVKGDQLRRLLVCLHAVKSSVR